jgi:hypothetical protein
MYPLRSVFRSGRLVACGERIRRSRFNPDRRCFGNANANAAGAPCVLEFRSTASKSSRFLIEELIV